MNKSEDQVLKQLHEQCIIDCDALLQKPIPRLFSAVELLEERGWEASHWDLNNGLVSGAVMHRPAD